MKRVISDGVEFDNIVDSLLSAIEQGINETITNDPIATIKRDGDGLCITTQGHDKYFEAMVNVFSDICSKHGVSKLPGSSAVATIRNPQHELYKYEFNISIDDFHKILIIESEIYRGYRVGRSLINLKNPNMELIKDGKICLFPAIELSGDNKIMPRLAGCNTSEIISVQLAFLIKKYIPDTTGKIYGHHSSPIVDNLLGTGANIFFETITHYFKIYSYELSLKEKETIYKNNTIYVEAKDNHLYYSFKKYPYPEAEIIDGKIAGSNLPFSLSKPLSLEEMHPYFDDILKIITQSNDVDLYDLMNHQTENGFRTITSTEKIRSTLVDMNPDAFKIYTALGPVEVKELENLKSVELPVIDFLRTLKEIQLNYLEKAKIEKYISWINQGISIIDQLIAKVQLDNNLPSTEETEVNNVFEEMAVTQESEKLIIPYVQQDLCNAQSDHIADQEIEINKQVEKLGADFANEIQTELLNRARYQNDDSIYDALRESTFKKYNSYGLTNPQNYVNNIVFLRTKEAKQAIKACTDKELSSHKTRINSSADIASRGWTPFATSKFKDRLKNRISNNLFYNVYDALSQWQYSAYQIAMQGRIGTYKM